MIAALSVLGILIAAMAFCAAFGLYWAIKHDVFGEGWEYVASGWPDDEDDL